MKWFWSILIGLAMWALFNRDTVRRLYARWRDGPLAASTLPPLPPPADDPHGPALAEALERAGYFDGLDAPTAEVLADRIRREGYAALFMHDWRCAFADDEELAEGALERTLPDLAATFARLGVPPLRGAARFEDGGAMWFDEDGGTPLPLLSRAESERDAPGRQPGLTWGLVGARLAQHLDARLAAAGRQERIWSVYGGNDAQMLVLTPAMAEAIIEHGGMRGWERPYRRTEHWPDFGQPPATP